ncbi:MAG: TIM barrel protein [Pseudomonadota bacterium]
MIEPPKLACCNFFPDVDRTRSFALAHGFSGVEWTFTWDDLAHSLEREERLAEETASLYPLEVRFHAALKKVGLGLADEARSAEGLEIMKRLCRLAVRCGGRFMTIHLGLGRDSTWSHSWDGALARLKKLYEYARELGLTLCLENLAWGWTSKPNLFEKLIRGSGMHATLDIGHARASESVTSLYYQLEDFTLPHPEKFLSAHIYHEETDDRHVAPTGLNDLVDRLNLLWRLPHCEWWVLELREEEPLLQTLNAVREYLGRKLYLGGEMHAGLTFEEGILNGRSPR